MSTPDAIEITATVTFTSDWHIGTGRGRAREIDSAIVRDPFGLPYLPAKSFTGVLRDSAEIAAGALDAGDSGPWHEWVDYIFGSQPARAADSKKPTRARPIPAALTGGPLLLSQQLVDTLMAAGGPGAGTDAAERPPWQLTRQELLAACTVIRPGVAIDPVTGTAREDFLRFEERARGGLAVGATWQLATQGVAIESLWPAALLLECAARLTDAIGGKRRRGAGRATVSLTGEGLVGGRDGEKDEALNKLFERAKGVLPPSEVFKEVAAGPMAADAAPPEASGDLVHRFDLDIEARTPVLVDTTLRGNTVTSAPAIPGAALLPIVSLGIKGGLSRLIQEGSIVVTPATAIVEEHRSWPWPQCLAISKDEANSSTATNLLRPHAFNPRLKPRSSWQVSASHGEPKASYDVVEFAESIHAIIEDKTQRPTSETGGLFVYCGIAPGTRLRAEVWLPAGIEFDIKAVDGRHAIGRSSKDDFGDVAITVQRVADEQHERLAILAKKPFSVWLTTDVILRNDRGMPDPRPEVLAAELAAQLDCGTVTLAEATVDGDLSTDSSRMSVTRRESWQTAWGLPRPSLVGIAAGSVLTFIADKPISVERIVALESHGIGERRAEGYGRIAIDHPLLQRDTVPVQRATRSQIKHAGKYWQAPDDQPVTRHADVITMAAWRRKIAEHALTRSGQIRKTYLPDKTSNAQLGTLRQLVLQLDESGRGFEHFFAWHERMSTLAGSSRTQLWDTDTLKALDKLVRSVWALLDARQGDQGQSRQQSTLVWQQLFGDKETEVPSDFEQSANGPLALQALKLMLIEACKAAITEARTAAVRGSNDEKEVAS